MTNDHAPPIWEQRENESAKAYAAFLLYRDLGRGRSLEKASSTSGKGRVKVGQLEKWSPRHQWVNRCAAWDKYQYSLDEKALEDLRQLKRIEIVNAELDDYEKLRAQWNEQAGYIRPVNVQTHLEDGRQVNILKVTPYEFKAHIESRRKISEGLRLFAELPSKIERSELTGKGGESVSLIMNVVKMDVDEL